MAVLQLDTHIPQIDDTAWIADNAQVIGEVEMAAHSSVWFSSVLRGDSGKITIGEGSNIQDGSVLHVDIGLPLTIGKHVTVGHMVQRHGCTIGDETLIGIGAIVLNGAKIGKNCLVGAGSLVTEGKEFPDGSMILGSPAKVVRELTSEQMEGVRKSAKGYMANAQRYKSGLKKLS